MSLHEIEIGKYDPVSERAHQEMERVRQVIETEKTPLTGSAILEIDLLLSAGKRLGHQPESVQTDEQL